MIDWKFWILFYILSSGFELILCLNSTEFAHYQSNCLNNPCDSSRNFTCSPTKNRCVCAAESDNKYIYMYNVQFGSCTPILQEHKEGFLKCERFLGWTTVQAKNNDNSSNSGMNQHPMSCKSHHECQLAFNSQSQCNFETCTCECVEKDIETSFYVEFRDWECKITQRYGKQCLNDGNCFNDNSICNKTTSICQCREHFQWNEEKQECTFDSPNCLSDENCKSFGDLSKCFSTKTSSQCICQEDASFIQGKCSYKRNLHENCSTDIECNGANSICTNTKCNCQDGYILTTKDTNMEECLPIAKTLNFPCKSSEQCSIGLGELSVCVRGSCRCVGREVKYDPIEAKCVAFEYGNPTKDFSIENMDESPQKQSGISSVTILACTIAGLIVIILALIGGGRFFNRKQPLKVRRQTEIELGTQSESAAVLN